MSEVESRPPPSRGRSSHRGGRGGFGRGGARGGRKYANGSSTHDTSVVDSSLDDQGELGEMKKKYASELVSLKDMFPDWTDVDLVFALHETDGDVPSTVDHITQGSVSQFAEVKNSKEKTRAKPKETQAGMSASDKPAAARAGRGRGNLEGARGARGRASDRGRGGHRGGRGGGTINGAGKESGVVSVPTAESAAWDGNAGQTNGAEGHDSSQVSEQTALSDSVHPETISAGASESTKSSLIPEQGVKKSWASMFAPKPTLVTPKKSIATPTPHAEIAASGQPLAVGAEKLVVPSLPDEAPSTPSTLEPPASTTRTAANLSDLSPHPPTSADGEDITLTPPKNPLTEENVEHLPDESVPPATHTVASTTGSVDPRNLTPLPNAQTPVGRPPIGGYAASAYRATGGSMRSASFQRKIQAQQEAVVMPGHNAVDRAAVQFGSMGLNGEPGPDVDEDREEPETRQAPQHSPPSQPKTSLPPVPRQTAPAHELPEGLPTPKQAPGLPPASQQNQQQMQEAAINQGMGNEQSQISQGYHQYGRYGQPGYQQDSGVQQQKPYDPFNHQPQPNPYDHYGMHPQHQVHQQQQQQQQGLGGFGGLSSAPTDASSYYTADQQRSAYNQYYGGSYGPPDSRAHGNSQDAGAGQQRSTSGFGAASNESTFPAHTQQQVQSRVAETVGSGNNTPNLLPGSLQQQPQQQQNPNASQSQHSMHQAPGHQQQQHQQQQHQQQQHQQQQAAGYGAAHAGFPYGHPYYNSPYQQAYNNQFGYSHQAGGYGGGYPSKQGMYGGSHGYAMAPQSSFEQHSSSPANSGAFGQSQQTSMRGASGMSGLGGSGLDEYGRGASQSQQQPSGFGGLNDPFARSTSGFGSQGGYGQQSMAGQEESLKPYSEHKGGPSPALGQPGRPGSTVNNATSSAQAGLPPPQSHQSSFAGGYGGFPGQSQYSGLGGLGTQQHAQNAMGGQGAYGSYGASGFSQTYGGYGSSRGGWGSNYGAH